MSRGADGEWGDEEGGGLVTGHPISQQAPAPAWQALGRTAERSGAAVGTGASGSGGPPQQWSWGRPAIPQLRGAATAVGVAHYVALVEQPALGEPAGVGPEKEGGGEGRVRIEEADGGGGLGAAGLGEVQQTARTAQSPTRAFGSEGADSEHL